MEVSSWFAEGERAEKLASMVLLSLTEEEAPTNAASKMLTIPSLNEMLLRSANFYEAKCFKGWSLVHCHWI